MQKLMLTLLVAIVALAPAFAAAQTGSGSTPGSSGSSPSGTTGGSSGSGTTGSGGATTAPGASGRSSGSPSASPSGTVSDFSKYTTKATCEKAGGMWQVTQNKCEKK